MDCPCLPRREVTQHSQSRLAILILEIHIDTCRGRRGEARGGGGSRERWRGGGEEKGERRGGERLALREEKREEADVKGRVVIRYVRIALSQHESITHCQQTAPLSSRSFAVSSLPHRAASCRADPEVHWKGVAGNSPARVCAV